MKRSRLALIALAALVVAGCGGIEFPLIESRGKHPLAAQLAQPSDYTDVVQHLYVSYYGRPADPAGLKFWADYLAQGQAPTTLQEFVAAYASNPAVKTVVDNFGQSDESTALYGADSNAIVIAIYKNLFNREPDSAGLQFYINGLNNKLITNAQAAMTIAGGAQGTDTDTVKTKVAIASKFTNSLTTPDQALAYSGLEINAKIRMMLARYNRTTDYDYGAGGLLAVTENKLFNPVPILLPDLKAKFGTDFCKYQLNAQNGIAADLNGDGRKDLLFTLWCGVVPGIPYTAPVVNTLVAFTQNPDGSWTDSTASIFGNDIADIGGIAGNNAVYDFNGDGYVDFAFAVNREDGRSSTDETNDNQKAHNAVAMSQGDGIYKISAIGQLAWNADVRLSDNAFGTKDVTFIPWGPQETYRFTETGWQRLDGYDWVTDPSVLFIKNPKGANKAVIPVRFPEFGLELWSKNDSSWSRSDIQSLGTLSTIKWISWQRNVGSATSILLDGTRYITPSISHTCELRLTPTSPSMVVAVFAGLEIDQVAYSQSADSARELFDESGGYLRAVSRLIGYNISNNELSKTTLVITGGKRNVSDYRFNCEDVNGDGYDDILITDWRSGTRPVIYLNSKNGTFTALPDSAFPTPKPGYETQLYVDIDGDGIRDMIYWPIVGMSTDKVQYQIFKGIRQITQEDASR